MMSNEVCFGPKKKKSYSIPQMSNAHVIEAINKAPWVSVKFTIMLTPKSSN